MNRATGKTAEAYKAIESMILYEEIEPDSLVSEAQLMRMTGLGRTPVREALQQLSRNRLVEIYPNKGVLVPRVSVEAQLKILEARRVLEVLAITLACERATQDEMSEMAKAVSYLEENETNIKEYISIVYDTHNMIALAAHNDYLATSMAPLQGLSRRFWISRMRHEHDEIKKGKEIHIQMLKAIIARDKSEAEKRSLELNDYLVNFALESITNR